MEKMTIATNVVKFFTGFFTDKNGKTSRKSAALYISFFFMYLLIQGMPDDGTVNPSFLALAGMLLVIILYCIDAIRKETVEKLADKIIDKDEPGT